MKSCYSDGQQNSCPRELESYRSICFIIRLTGQQIETLKVERTCFRENLSSQFKTDKKTIKLNLCFSTVL